MPTATPMTRILMMASGWLMAAAGITLSIAPQETATAMGYRGAVGVALTLQLLGALYLGFAFVNWMGKGNLLGGIYGRPVSLGNFVHFLVAGFAILRQAYANGNVLLWGAAVTYAFLAASFGLVCFGPPYYKPVD